MNASKKKPYDLATEYADSTKPTYPLEIKLAWMAGYTARLEEELAEYKKRCPSPPESLTPAD